jgi:hypothetical protein
MSGAEKNEKGRTLRRAVLIAFAAAIAVFVITHLLPLPGSVKVLAEATGGQPILDLDPSFSADEVYRRLAAFGEEGRAMYKRTLLTSDIAFPLSLLVFFHLFARHAAAQLSPPKPIRLLLLAMPFAYFLSDLVENAGIFAMLANYPVRLDLVGDNLGYVTAFKRAAQFAALLLPPTLFFAAEARRLSALPGE